MTSGQFRFDPPSSGGGDVRRAAAAVAVQGLYRLVKACLLHSDSNQAIAQLVPAAVAAVGDFCAVSGVDGMSLVFAEEGIFVNGQVLRTSREGYDTARELGSLIGACGVNELTLEKGVRAPELSAFARLLAEAQRDRAAAERLARAELRGVRVRSVPSPAGRAAQAAPAPELPLLTRSIRVYAASLLVMRAAHAELRATGGAPLDQVRRAAQKLVSLAEEDTRPLLTLAVSIEGDPDDAALSVATAVVALAIARQLTTERRSLSALATAALLYDAGRRRLLRPAAPPGERSSVAPPAIDRALDEEEQARLPASAAAALASLGMLHAPSMARTVILYEALALRPDARPRSRALLLRGRRSPTLLARALAVARAFTELRAVPPLGGGAEARAPLDEVLQRLLDLTAGAGAPGGWGSTERALVRLLGSALGVEAPPSSRTPAPRAAPVPASRRSSSPQMPASRSSSPRLPATRASSPPGPPSRAPAPAAPQVQAVRPAPASSGPSAQPSGGPPSTQRPTLPPPRLGERVRTAPAPLEGLLPPASQPVAAAWLGRPLTPPNLPAAEPPRSAKRPPPIDRAALLEKLRQEDLASTQPPPPDVFEQPVVPPPPRLPTESAPPSARPPGAALFSAPSTEPRSKPAPGAPRSAGPISASPLALKPPGANAGLAQSPPSSRGRRFDPRAEPLDEETWTDELHTMAPPPAPSTMDPPPAPSTMDPPPPLSTALPPAPPPTLRGSHLSNLPPLPPTLPGASHGEADTLEEWPDLDDLPLVEPSPAAAAPDDEAAAAAARDRLLAEYLAEMAPAPSSRSGLPSRPPIPREEPPEPPTRRRGER